MRKLIATTISTCWITFAVAAFAVDPISTDVTANDANALAPLDKATADGATVIGMRKGKLYAVVMSTAIVSQGGSEEAKRKQKNEWLETFKTRLFDAWIESACHEGQVTLDVSIDSNNSYTVERWGRLFLNSDNSKLQKGLACQQLKESIQKSLHSALTARGIEQAPFKKGIVAITFACDSQMFPRFGAIALGQFNFVNDRGTNFFHLGRLSRDSHHIPSIEIRNIGDSAQSIVTDDAQFQKLYSKALTDQWTIPEERKKIIHDVDLQWRFTPTLPKGDWH